jgi:branched-chain amino acid transport system substrate-binding protein
MYRAKDTVKIAYIGPLTGGVSANGIGGRNSADLAVRLKNQDPSAKYKYELVAADDECKPNVGVQVATKIASDNSIIAGVTHYCSAVAMSTVDVYHKFGLPVMVWGAVLPEITYGNDYKEVHRVNGTMINQNEVAAKFLTGLGYKNGSLFMTQPIMAKVTINIFHSTSPRMVDRFWEHLALPRINKTSRLS